MATSRMVAGSRPARPAARARRSRTSASRARSAAGSVMHPRALFHQRLQSGDDILRSLGVRARRRELEVHLEFLDSFSEVAFPDEHVAQTVVCLGMVRFRGDGGLKL